MAKKYSLAIFDLDGTLLDTLEDLADSLNHALEQCGFPQKTKEEVRSFVGNGRRRLIERSVPKDTAASEIDKIFAAFDSYYQIHCMDKTKPYEGIIRLLDSLRKQGFKLAVISNKGDGAVQDLCSRIFKDRFDIVMGEREGIRKKPAPDSVNEVLTRLGIPKEAAIYIGDSEVDILTAKNAGMDACIVTWGFRDAAYLKEQGAPLLASSTEELYRILAPIL